MARTTRVEEMDVMLVPEPRFTRSWHPIGHRRLVETMTRVVDREGLRVTDKHYSLSTYGDQMFAEWVLEGTGNLRHMIGFRNSINKAFAIGVVAGLYIMVCSNMVMKGDFIEFRKHTSGLDDLELLDLANRTIGQVTERFARLEAWHETLREIPLMPQHSNWLTLSAMRQGALPPSKFGEFDTLFFQPGGTYFSHEPTLALFHGALTDIMHTDSLFNISRKNSMLSDLVDDFKTLVLTNRNNVWRL